MVFMHQIMTVHHKFAFDVFPISRPKPSCNPDRLKGAQAEDILPASLMGWGFPAIASKNLPIHQVDMDRMHPTPGNINQVPNLNGAGFWIGIDPPRIPAFVID